MGGDYFVVACRLSPYLARTASAVSHRANWRSAFSAAFTLRGAKNAASRCRYRPIVAAACGATVALAAQDSKTFESIQATLKVVLAHYGRDTIEAALSPRELTRLGNAAGNAREFKGALRVLDRAIHNDATFEDAYWLRAGVRVQIGDTEAAAADALQRLYKSARLT